MGVGIPGLPLGVLQLAVGPSWEGELARLSVGSRELAGVRRDVCLLRKAPTPALVTGVTDVPSRAGPLNQLVLTDGGGIGDLRGRRNPFVILGRPRRPEEGRGVCNKRSDKGLAKAIFEPEEEGGD